MFNCIEQDFGEKIIRKLMFVVMMFALMIFATDRALAQNAASKKSDDQQVYVEIANMTDKAFTVSVVYAKINEIPAVQETPAGEIFEKIVSTGQAFRVRQAGSNKMIHQFVLNAAKPIIFIETDGDGSNLKVREFEGDRYYQKRADDAFAALGNESESESDNAVAEKSKLDAFKKRLIGTWKGKTGGIRYDQNTLTSFDSRGNKGVTVAYRIIDEKTVEVAITKDFKFSSSETITFKDNGNTLVQFSSISKDTNEYKRVK